MGESWNTQNIHYKSYVRGYFPITTAGGGSIASAMVYKNHLHAIQI